MTNVAALNSLTPESRSAAPEGFSLQLTEENAEILRQVYMSDDLLSSWPIPTILCGRLLK